MRAINIDYDFDMDEVYEKLDNMEASDASDALCVPLRIYERATTSERHDIAYNAWHHCPALLDEFMEVPDKIEIPFSIWNDEDAITDYISDVTGYCIKNYDLEESHRKLFGVKAGIVCQQCNCVGAYGAGISGAISSVFPEVYDDFKTQYFNNKGNQFGTNRIIQVDDRLYVANIYSQDGCGANGLYTDMVKLAANICDIANQHKNLPVYLPHSKNIERDGIGCGLGGGKWSDLVKILQRQHLTNVFVLNTIEGKVVENINDVDIKLIQKEIHYKHQSDIEKD